MEQITECLVKKDMDGFDVVKRVAVFLVALIGSMLVFWIVSMVQFLSTMAIFFAAMVIYLAYRYSQTTDVEFEYCVVNGDIDVDRIFAKKRRKRLVSVAASRIEKIIPIESEEIKTRNDIRKVYFAAKNKKDDTNYAVIFKGQRGTEMLIVVEDKDFLLHMMTIMPKKVEKRA